VERKLGCGASDGALTDGAAFRDGDVFKIHLQTKHPAIQTIGSTIRWVDDKGQFGIVSPMV
jgi:hypothetical protein